MSEEREFVLDEQRVPIYNFEAQTQIGPLSLGSKKMGAGGGFI